MRMERIVVRVDFYNKDEINRIFAFKTQHSIHWPNK